MLTLCNSYTWKHSINYLTAQTQRISSGNLAFPLEIKTVDISRIYNNGDEKKLKKRHISRLNILLYISRERSYVES